jgi:hypothetical protein
MKNLVLLVCVMGLSLNAFTATLGQRVNSAIQNCLKPKRTNLEVFYTNAPSDMIQYYTPNIAQRVMFPVYKSVYDKFGSKVQAMFSDDEQVHADGYLTYLGELLNKKRMREQLSRNQTICLASCLTNHLMMPDMEVAPTTSMQRSVTIGKGFCRHFVLATDRILRSSGIRTKFGISWEHIFMYSQHEGKRVIFDPVNNDSVYSCEFYDDVK